VTTADPRVRVLNDAGIRRGADYVLYWCQIARRPRDNLALEIAIEHADALGLPCLFYEGLRPDYPYASDRFHTFVLEGARDTARALRARGIAHAFFLPRTKDEARGVVAKLAERAALVVSDDSPTFIAEHNARAARRVGCRFVAIDDNAVVPLALFPKQEHAARTLRPKLHKVLDAWLVPLVERTPRKGPPARLDLPFPPLDLDRADVASLVASCAIDHAVAPVAEVRGGAEAAEERLDRFIRRRLASYAADRNDPARDATSGLSPYLHFGMIGARRVALAVRDAGRDGAYEGATAFLEQLLVRRGLAFNFAARQPKHASYDAVPDWAKATLAAHERDRRPALLSIDDLEDARSPDPVWNAAQLELRARGGIQGYMRMLWAKLVITWTRTAREAFDALVRMNDRFALDGRDPDGYANIAWSFGLHDRPWPERPIFGTVRSMTSKSAASKLDLEGYLARARAYRDLVGS